MRIATAMLTGFLVVAAPLALADDDDARPSVRNPDASTGNTQTLPSTPGSAKHKQEDHNEAISADREQGLDRAQDRRSEEGRENTNAPNSPNRATGQDRADERHKQHDRREKPNNK